MANVIISQKIINFSFKQNTCIPLSFLLCSECILGKSTKLKLFGDVIQFDLQKTPTEQGFYVALQNF